MTLQTKSESSIAVVATAITTTITTTITTAAAALFAAGCGGGSDGETSRGALRVDPQSRVRAVALAAGDYPVV